MKLSEVFAVLLSAEEGAKNKVSAAENDVEKLRAESNEKTDGKRKAVMAEAQSKIAAILEESMKQATDEAEKIKNSAASAREKISEFFNQNIENIIASLSEEVAVSCVADARSE